MSSHNGITLNHVIHAPPLRQLRVESSTHHSHSNVGNGEIHLLLFEIFREFELLTFI